MRAKDVAVREREIPVVVCERHWKARSRGPAQAGPRQREVNISVGEEKSCEEHALAEIDQSPLVTDWSSVYGQAKLYTENPSDSKGLDGSTVCGVGMTYAPLGSFTCSRVSATGLIFDPSAAIAGPIGTGGLPGAASEFEVTC